MASMPLTTSLILSSATAKPWRVSKDALSSCSGILRRLPACFFDWRQPAFDWRQPAGVRILAQTHKSGIAAQTSDTQSPTTLRFQELTISTIAIPVSPDASTTVRPRNKARSLGSLSPLTSA